MAEKRSLRHRLYRVLGLLAVFSGAMLVYAGLQILNRKVMKARLRRYHRRLLRDWPDPISKTHFPLSYFKTAISPGMSPAAVDQVVRDGRRTVTREMLSKGSFAHVYDFSFSPLQRHRLVVLFDDQDQVVGLDGYQISVSLG